MHLTIEQLANFRYYVEGSIDETEERAEWIRSGTVWNTVKNNIRKTVESGVKWPSP